MYACVVSFSFDAQLRACGAIALLGTVHCARLHRASGSHASSALLLTHRLAFRARLRMDGFLLQPRSVSVASGPPHAAVVAISGLPPWPHAQAPICALSRFIPNTPGNGVMLVY